MVDPLDNTNPTPARRFPWHAVAIAAVTIACVWLFATGIDPREMVDDIRRADPWWLTAAVGMTLFGYVLRARRWQALLAPLGHARFRSTFRTTVIGFTVTNLLPGRLGEVLRPYLLSRTEGFKFSSALATIIIERVMDLASILLLFAWFLLATDVEVGESVKIAGGIGGLTAVAALVALGIGAGHPERLGRWAGRVAALLPGRFAEAVTVFVRTLAEGLAVMRRPGPLVTAFGLSMALWVSISLAIWLTSRALELTISPMDSFLIVGYLAVGVSIPTPGGVGGFDLAYKAAATNFFNIDPSQAATAALVLHAISLVPITLAGLLFMWQDGLTLKNMKTMSSKAEEKVEAPRP